MNNFILKTLNIEASPKTLRKNILTLSVIVITVFSLVQHLPPQHEFFNQFPYSLLPQKGVFTFLFVFIFLQNGSKLIALLVFTLGILCIRYSLDLIYSLRIISLDFRDEQDMKKAIRMRCENAINAIEEYQLRGETELLRTIPTSIFLLSQLAPKALNIKYDQIHPLVEGAIHDTIRHDPFELESKLQNTLMELKGFNLQLAREKSARTKNQILSIFVTLFPPLCALSSILIILSSGYVLKGSFNL